MSKIYNNSLKAIFVKIVQINENIEDKELKKIDEIYFKLTGNNLSKKNIYNQILNINNIEPIESYLRKSIKLSNMIQKINILHAVEEFVVADGINLINGDELLSKLKKIIFEFK
jgi:hypothetical protein